MTDERATNPIIASRNKLSLGLFGLDVSNACSMVEMPGALMAKYG